jgi:hypothetical protein
MLGELCRPVKSNITGQKGGVATELPGITILPREAPGLYICNLSLFRKLGSVQPIASWGLFLQLHGWRTQSSMHQTFGQPGRASLVAARTDLEANLCALRYATGNDGTFSFSG